MTPSLQHSAEPILAIVGRPNVGKSTLFNRIAGRRIAIVHEEAGVTRDRVSAPARWREKSFEVIDTGGIMFVEDEKTDDVIGAAIKRQAEIAIDMAAVIVLVVDVMAGLTPLDLELARKLRTSGKPVLLAINKVDNRQRESAAGEFGTLGFEHSFPLAAAHGTGVDELLETATAQFPSGAERPAATAPRIAIVGKPNAGKSSLINAILHSERTIVSEVPGTTRDSVDVPFILDGKEYTLVDTAGLRHRSKITNSVDQFGLMRAERSIRECDIAVLVLDAVSGVTQQDKRIGGMIAEAGRGCVILVNKWDLAAEEEQRTEAIARKPVKGFRGLTERKHSKTFQDEYVAAIRKELFFLAWAPVLFASAKTGLRVSQMFQLLASVEESLRQRAETPKLNQLLNRAVEAYPPTFVHGKRLKIFYAFQSDTRPPTFKLFVNDRRCLTPHYERFLTDRIRSVWPFTGCPVQLRCQDRERRKFIGKMAEK